MPHPVLTNGGTSVEWALENPILPANLTGIEIDTGKYKIGNGLSYWNALEYGVKNISSGGGNISNPYENLTPTHFFDPTKSGSTGVGTFINPFRNNAEINAWLTSIGASNRNVAGKILGMKRGAVYQGFISMNSIYGTLDSPFIMCPYGDEEQPPEISAMYISTGWVQYSSDTRLWYKAAQDFEDDYWDISNGSDYTEHRRYYKKSSLENLQAAGEGHSFLDTNFIYLFPFDGQNPNFGQTIQTQATTTSTLDTPLISLGYAGRADTGNLQIHGMKVSGGRYSGIQIVSSAAASNINGLVVNDCIVGKCGQDTATGTAPASDAILINGSSKVNRAVGTVVSYNVIYDVLNCAVELSAQTAPLVENNTAKYVGGKSVVELWYSCSNAMVRYNKGLNMESVGRSFGRVFGQVGIWVPGYSGGSGAGTEDKTENTGNIFAFNYIAGMQDGASARGVTLGPGTSTFINNTVIGAKETAPLSMFLSSSVATADREHHITMYNNLLVSRGHVSARGFAAVNAASTVLGSNNLFCIENGGGASVSSYRGTDYSTIAALVTAIQTAQSDSSMANCKSGNPLLNASGIPLPGSAAANAGVAQTGYNVDLSGKPLIGNHIGAYAPK